MSGHCNLMDSERIDDLLKILSWQTFLDANILFPSIGEAHLKDRTAASNEIIVQNISVFLPYLEERDMILVLEVHGDHGSGEILKKIVEMVGNSRVKINYDTANAVFTEGSM